MTDVLNLGYCRTQERVEVRTAADTYFRTAFDLLQNRKLWLQLYCFV